MRIKFENVMSVFVVVSLFLLVSVLLECTVPAFGLLSGIVFSGVFTVGLVGCILGTFWLFKNL